MNSLRRTGIVLALGTAVISGVSVFVNSYGVRAFADATVYTTAKNVVAALVLALVVTTRATGARLTRPPSRRQWWALGVVGLLGGSIPFVLFFEGLSRASSGGAAVIHKTLVLWVAVLAVALLKERLQWGHWLAIGLLLVGQLGLAGGRLPSLGSAELMILAATAMWSVEVVVAKRLLGSLSSWIVGLARMGLGSLALLAWLLVRGDLAALTALTWTQLGWVLTTGLLLAGYVATWLAALKRAQAVDVTAVLVLAVLVTAALAGAFDGVAVGAQAPWLALIAAGGLLVWLAPRHRARDGAGTGRSLGAT